MCQARCVHLCVCTSAGVYVHLCTPACAGYWCIQNQCCTNVPVLYRLSYMPVMDEIVRDFKVVERSSESDSVFRQAVSGLPDKPLNT